jgi:choline dehydrogenase-like flavoprotein
MTPERTTETPEHDARVHANQRRLAAETRPSYDFIVCGSGSSGSVVARRLAETGDASVLLLEAGGTDDVPSVREPGQWPANLRTERDWGFEALPNLLPALARQRRKRPVGRARAMTTLPGSWASRSRWRWKTASYSQRPKASVLT